MLASSCLLSQRGCLALLPLMLLCLSAARAAIPLPDAQLREQASAAVVNLQTESGSGSGFLINGNGDVATNFHVVEGARRITVRQGLQSAPASLVWTSPELDLAVVRLRGGALGGARPLALALAEPNPLQDVIAVGFPGAADMILTSNEATPSFTQGSVGRVVAGSWDVRELRIVQHNADISPGNSGGPLLDRCGRAVGINTGGPASRVTISSLFGGQINNANGVFFASFIGELAEELRRQSIPFAAVNDACAPAGAAALAAPVSPSGFDSGFAQADLPGQPGALAGNELAQSRDLLLILTLVAVLIAVLLIIALVSFGSFRRSIAQLGAGALHWIAPRWVASRWAGQSIGPGGRAAAAPARAGSPVTIRIGRGRRMDLRLVSPQVSRLHAELTVSRNPADGQYDYRLRDCGSSNGSSVFRDDRWQPVGEMTVLANEKLRLGDQTSTAAELYAIWQRENAAAGNSEAPAGAGAGSGPDAGPDSGLATGAGTGTGGKASPSPQGKASFSPQGKASPSPQGKASPSPQDALPSGRVKRDLRTGDVIRE